MKAVKLFIGMAFALVVGSASAQDFSDPQYAKWGETPEQRKENILASTFLKEELNNRNYNQAAKYLQQLFTWMHLNCGISMSGEIIPLENYIIIS